MCDMKMEEKKTSTLYPGDHAHQTCHRGKMLFLNSFKCLSQNTGSKFLKKMLWQTEPIYKAAFLL